MSKRKTIINGIFATGLLLSTVHMANKLINCINSKYNLLSEACGSYYKWKFGFIYYTKTGSGPPVLLVHDLDVSSSSHEWSRVIDLLAIKNTVYALDLLGCGRSDKPAIPYTDYLYVQLIRDFINDVINSKVNVISTGNSSSFTIASYNEDNENIKGVYLVNPRSLTPPSHSPYSHIFRQVLYLPILGTFIYNLLVRRSAISKRFASDYYKDCLKIRSSDIAIYTENAHLHKSSAKFLYASIISGLTSTTIAHRLNKINVIQMIVGEEDSKSNIVAANYQLAFPSVKVHQLEACKYLPQLESPEKLVHLIHTLL